MQYEPIYSIRDKKSDETTNEMSFNINMLIRNKIVVFSKNMSPYKLAFSGIY